MEQKTSRIWRTRLYETVFEADTFAGKLFDVCLLILILASVVTITLETVPSLYNGNKELFFYLELLFTIIFSIEYILRLIASKKPLNYVRSFYGIVDLLSILPTYLAIIFPAFHYFLIIRVIRLLRVFRIFKMVHFLNESLHLLTSLWNARRKIAVFFLSVILLTILCGALMFIIEHESNEAFHSIPQSIYWAIVTLTTVGYGDISPITPLGKVVACFIMLLGYCIIAVPTGIVSASLVRGLTEMKTTTQTCPHCHKQGHEVDADYCKFCGTEL